MFEAYQKGNLPDRFKNRKSPLKRTPANVEAGMKLYQANCVMCHGANAAGKGHMSAVMEEKPADLREMLKNYPDADSYYYWIISVGGAGFGIPMPGYDRQLSETEIWRLVSWMQAGFPGAGDKVKDHMPGSGMGPGMHMGSGMHMGPGMRMGPGMHPGTAPKQ